MGTRQLQFICQELKTKTTYRHDTHIEINDRLLSTKLALVERGTVRGSFRMTRQLYHASPG